MNLILDSGSTLSIGIQCKLVKNQRIEFSKQKADLINTIFELKLTGKDRRLWLQISAAYPIVKLILRIQDHFQTSQIEKVIIFNRYWGIIFDLLFSSSFFNILKVHRERNVVCSSEQWAVKSVSRVWFLYWSILFLWSSIS